MKKLLVGILILAFVVITSFSMAAGPKVPKALCISFAGYSSYTNMLAIKSIGSVPSSDGNIKMYTISGYSNLLHPVHGSGYVASGSTVFHATYKAQDEMDNPRLRSYELLFDLASSTGTISYTFHQPDGTTVVTYPSEPVSSIDCKGLTIFSSLEPAAEADKAD